MSILDETDVEIIKDTISIMGEECNLSQLAREMGVTRNNVSQIKCQKIWKDVRPILNEPPWRAGRKRRD